jgi:hypothetical protein
MNLTEKQEANLRGYFAQILAKNETDEFAIDKLIQAVKDLKEEEEIETP